MAHLAVVRSEGTHGVAQIHSHLLGKTVLKDLAQEFPQRFNNKTNGVTPRRWLLQANPDLAAIVTQAIGDQGIVDLSRLEKILPLADDRSFRDAFRRAKRAAKAR